MQHALSYITVAKNGLTESELEDILSCDEEVLEDVYQYWVSICSFDVSLDSRFHED